MKNIDVIFEKLKKQTDLQNRVEIIEQVLINSSGLLDDKEVEILVESLENTKKELIQKPINEEFKNFIYSIDEIQNTPPTTWLYPNVIPKNSIGVFYGASGGGKTTVLNWLLDKSLHLHPNLYVIAIDGDMGPSKLPEIGISKLMKAYGERFIYAGKQKGVINFSQTAQKLLLKIVELQKQHPQRHYLVVEDSLMLTSPKKRGFIDTEQLYKYERLLRDNGGGAILIHHLNKGGVFADSQQIENYADFTYLVERNDFNSTILLHPKKASRYEIQGRAFKVSERKIIAEEIYDDVNVSAAEIEFVNEITALLLEVGELKQNELMSESKSIRNRLLIGEKRAMRWLEKWAQKGKWKREQRASMKNAIFYWIEKDQCKAEKLQNSLI
jgi:hypothetical protein